MNGGHGQIVQQHAIMAFKRGQEHVPVVIQIIKANHLPNKRVATCKNAVMSGRLGQIAVPSVKQEQELVQADRKTMSEIVWRLRCHLIGNSR